MQFDVNDKGNSTQPVRAVTVLHGITSPETAYQVTDYPYGYRQTCTARWWVQTAEKGQYAGKHRLVMQTRNPRTNRWNNPKPYRFCTYSELLVVYTNTGEENRAPDFHAADRWMPPQRAVLMGLDGSATQLDPEQASVMGRLLHESIELDARAVAAGQPGQWSRWADAVAYGVAQFRATGQVPMPESGMVGPHYVGGQYAQVYRAAVENLLTQGEAVTPDRG